MTDGAGREPDSGGASARDAPPALRRPPRARGLWVAVGALGAVLAGAAVGWAAPEVTYRSQGLIRVRPPVHDAAGPAPASLPKSRAYVAHLVTVFRSRRATLRALATQAWQETAGSSGGDAVDRFEKRRTVLHVRGSHFIQVTFVASRPGLAAAGVRALIEAGEALHVELNDCRGRIDAAQRQIEDLRERFRATTSGEFSLTGDCGGREGLARRLRHALTEVSKLEAGLHRVRERLSERSTPSEEADNRRLELGVRAAQIEARLTVLREHVRVLRQAREDLERVGAEKDESGGHVVPAEGLEDGPRAASRGPGALEVVEWGSWPTSPLEDPRGRYAAVGAGVGGVLGVFVFALFALVRRRRSD